MGEEFLPKIGGQKRGKCAAFHCPPPKDRMHHVWKTVELETKFQSKNISPCQFFQNSAVIHLWIFIIRI